MKKLFQKIVSKLLKRAIKKSVNDIVSNHVADSEIPGIEPVTLPEGNSKKDKWKFVIQVIISILTALAAALTTTSCVNHF